MSTGPHIHDWHYGDAEVDVNPKNGDRKYTAIRYCKQCLFVEEVKLNNEQTLGKTNAS